MAAEEAYLHALRGAQARIAQKMGSNLSGADKQTRTLVLSSLMVNAFIIRILVEKGLITDSELLSRINRVHLSEFVPDHVPTEPEQWDMNPVTGV